MEAYEAALPEGYNVQKFVNRWKPTLNNTFFTDEEYLIVGEGCGVPRKEQLEDIKFSSVDMEKEFCVMRHVGQALSMRGISIYITNAPEWLGGGKALGYGVITEQDGYYVPGIGQRYPAFFKKVPALANFDTRQFMLEMTKRLPEWVYFYSAPNQQNGGYPVVFTQGRAEYFVR